MSEIDIQLFSRRILIDHYAVKENSISIFMILKKIWYAKVLQFPLYIYNIFHITYTQHNSITKYHVRKFLKFFYEEQLLLYISSYSWINKKTYICYIFWISLSLWIKSVEVLVIFIMINDRNILSTLVAHMDPILAYYYWKERGNMPCVEAINIFQL